MKYSFMTFSTPGLALADVIDVAARYGYDGIEPRLDQEHAHGIEVTLSPDERKAIRERVASSGIALACLATSLKFADPANAEDMIDETHARIDLAGDVGAPAIRVFGGRVPKGVGRERAADAIVEALRTVADHAAGRGVTLCMETHDDWRDPADVARILERVGHEAVGANWDVMHPVRARKATVEESFGILGPWVRHVHFHDGGVPDGGLVPIGTGGVDHGRMVELLAAAGFAGYLSGEWIGWEPYEAHLPRELATMKRYERDAAAAGETAEGT